MTITQITRRSGYVEVNQNQKLFMLGEKPWISRDPASDFAISLNLFGFRIYLECQQDRLFIDGKQPRNTEETVEALYKLFN
jgi:hypothetical protein